MTEEVVTAKTGGQISMPGLMTEARHDHDNSYSAYKILFTKIKIFFTFIIFQTRRLNSELSKS